MKILLKLTIALTIFLLILFSQGTNVEAALSPHFGGLEVGLIPCTCQGSSVNTLGIFFPLYLNSGVLRMGFLGIPNSISYANYYVRPGSWGLGTYLPGAAICMVGAYPYCFSFPNSGLILSFTGSSL